MGYFDFVLDKLEKISNNNLVYNKTKENLIISFENIFEINLFIDNKDNIKYKINFKKYLNLTDLLKLEEILKILKKGNIDEI